METMINYDEFGYEYQLCLVKNLQNTDVLIGESGGLSAIYNIEKSSIMDPGESIECFVLETEHGSVYIDADIKVAIIKRFEEKEYEISVSNRFFAESHEDAVLQMAAWINDSAYTAGYRVAEIDSMSGNTSVEVNSKFIDFENLMKHPGAIYGD